MAFIACGKKAELPSQFTTAQEQAVIYPDYRDIVIPSNIAPLNFLVKDNEADECVAEFKGEKGSMLVASGDELTIQIDTTEWRSLLSENRGKTITVNIYAHHNDR